MAWKIYFILGDILACASVGAASGWLASAIVSQHWWVALAMVVGMIAGVLPGAIGAMLFSPVFGSFEIMLPTSLSGMVAGMTLGMIDAHVGIGGPEAVWGGALVGLACLAATYVMQLSLRGEVT